MVRVLGNASFGNMSNVETDDSSLLSSHAAEVFDMLVLYIFMAGITSTLELETLRDRIKSPKGLIVGTLAQYAFLPPIGYGVSLLFELSVPQTVGLVAICCCPGGSGSNILCRMFKADVALSIALTGLSSFLAFALLPLNLNLYLQGTSGDFELDPWGLSKFTLVIVSGTLTGLLVKKYSSILFLKFTQRIASVCIVYLLIHSIALNATSTTPFWTLPVGVIVAVCTPVVCGHIFGFGVSVLWKLEKSSAAAVALEVSVQNKFLALGLVGVIFNDVDDANIAKGVPLLYGGFAALFNVCMLSIYWKLGYTEMPDGSPFYAPLYNLMLTDNANHEAKVAQSPVDTTPKVTEQTNVG